MQNQNTLNTISQIVGAQNILTDEPSKKFYGKDLTQNFTPNPLAIVFPTKVEDVISLVKFANAKNVSLVPSGGRTGYSGGAVALHQELVVSFEKMNRILDFNVQDKTVCCEAGVITKKLQDFVLQKNLFYPVDFASSGSSQIGGNIATNAGGIKVIRYGLTRNWVAGLKVVTGSGNLLELNHGLIKNATGYDLRQLFIGSEGTLGFIVEATMRLISKPAESKVILLAVSDKKNISKILEYFSQIQDITAFEFFSHEALEYVVKEQKIKKPFDTRAPFYILIEYDSSDSNNELAIHLAEKYLNQGLIVEAIFNENEDQARRLWQYRETISMSLLKHTPYKFDIAVKPSQISPFMEDVDNLLDHTYKDINIIWFGHIGDGNLHLNVLKPENQAIDKFFMSCKNISKDIYVLIQQYQGSISAEHGVGLLKKPYLSYSKSLVEIEYMRAIKKIFDPNNIMNPGKIF